MRRITRMGGIRMWPEVFLPEAWRAFLKQGFPRLRRGLLFLASPRKSKQKEGDPGLAPAARVPCATRDWRGLRNSGYALRQCSPFFRQPLRCSAPPKGPAKPSVADEGFFDFGLFFGPTVAFQLSCCSPSPDAFRVPLRGAEQRRRAGGSRLAVFEPQASLASRPVCRVAQGIGAAGADSGVAFSLATFFWRSKRKYARPQGGKQRLRKPSPGITTTNSTP